MYSVVLMMAMTTGGDAAVFDRHHGGGCCGESGHGGRHHRGGGCGESCGGYSGCGSCGAYMGGCSTCGYGASYGPSMGGCATCSAGYGPTVVMAQPDAATIVVSLPADAKLTIDDEATASTSDRRVFVSPSLPTGKDFYYTLKAEITVEGKTQVVSQVVKVRAGEESRVTLAAPTGVAER
jgi:uncharacterized protein (TIGR03000 family)